MVTGGSIAVKNPQAFSNWLQKYGADRIILGADVRDGKLAISGWQEVTETELLPFLSEYAAKGVTKTICTDIGKDGMLQGPSVDLYTKILSAMPDLYVIASGGVSSVDDIVALEEAKVPAVIFGKAIYEGRIRLEDFKRFL